MKQETDSEKIARIEKNVTQIRVVQGIVAAITLLGFLGIVTISDFIKKTK